MDRVTLFRCDWCTSDPVYIQYHDTEWGVPLYADDQLFELLILEGAQAGLSWITILKRREAYRKAYDNFHAESMARWDEHKILKLRQDSTIIRNKLKIQSATKNAKAYLRLLEEKGSFSRFLWDFVDGQPKQNRWEKMEQVPAQTDQSVAMSKALKKRGFSFVGPTICYAFMQSAGMVNDHLVSCFRYEDVKKARR